MESARAPPSAQTRSLPATEPKSPPRSPLLQQQRRPTFLLLLCFRARHRQLLRQSTPPPLRRPISTPLRSIPEPHPSYQFLRPASSPISRSAPPDPAPLQPPSTSSQNPTQAAYPCLPSGRLRPLLRLPPPDLPDLITSTYFLIQNNSPTTTLTAPISISTSYFIEIRFGKSSPINSPTSAISRASTSSLLRKPELLNPLHYSNSSQWRGVPSQSFNLVAGRSSPCLFS